MASLLFLAEVATMSRLKYRIARCTSEEQLPIDWVDVSQGHFREKPSTMIKECKKESKLCQISECFFVRFYSQNKCK